MKKTGVTWKEISKKQKWFQIINTVLVVAILGIYLGRLFYYKDYFEKKASPDVTVLTLSEIMINKTSLTTSNNGLVKNEDDSYTYKGEVDNNYIVFDNMLFRALGIDADGRIRMIAENPVISFSTVGDQTFKSSAVESYLNDIYAKQILKSKAYLSVSSVAIDEVDDVNNIKNASIYGDVEVVLLSLDDYRQAGAASSFINNGQNFWLINTDSVGNNWFVDDAGGLSIDKDGLILRSLRPVLTLNFIVKATAGSGTIDDPYIVVQNDSKTIGDCVSGQYISYSNEKWRVSLSEDNGVVAILDGCLDEHYSFGKSCVYSPSDGIGKTLNTTYLKTLTNYEKYLVLNTWTTGRFKNINNYDYRDMYDSTYDCYVSIPDLRYPGFDTYGDCFIASQTYETTKAAYIITAYHSLYAALLETKMAVRPMICFNANVKIVGGLGTLEEPYILEVIE